jgi:hypothetical protein
VIYTLEFYWVDGEGGRAEIGRQSQIAKSSEVIEARARAIIKNVLIGGRRSNLCVIKDPTGKALNAVVGNSRRDRGKAPRLPAEANARIGGVIPSSA